jgi:hypothetical protein
MLEPVFSRRLFYIFVLVFLGLSLTLKSFAQVVDRLYLWDCPRHKRRRYCRC